MGCAQGNRREVKIQRLPGFEETEEEHKKKMLQTQNQLTSHNAKAFLITCMDFRLLDDIVVAMDQMGYNNNYDQFILAGASLGFVQEKFPYWGDTVMDHLEIGLNLHHFRKIIFIDHEDCGAYKKFMPYNNKKEELASHKKCLQDAFDKLKKKFPNFGFTAFLMDLEGNMKEIEIDRHTVKYDSNTVDHEKTNFLSEVKNYGQGDSK